MADNFRFSLNPNRATDIRWRPWGAAALAEAADLDRPVLLHLTAVWCHWCHLMDETTYSDPATVALINDNFLPIRVDADRFPHVQDRYIAGGWPTTAFLTPTGEVLWAGTYVEAEPLQQVATGVLGAWRDGREALDVEIARRRRALEAAGGRSATGGLVRREHADDVVTAVRHAFDARNGGFGDAPKFPQPEAIELMYVLAGEDPTWAELADQTLDGMLAGELWDAVDGGFYRYAMAPDWTAPRHEKLLEVNAGLLDAYALGALVRGRGDWAAVAAAVVDWVEATLRRPDGLWAGSQWADPAYFGADAAARAALAAPPVDDTVYTTSNARFAGALADAGARLGRPEWVARAASALDTLLRELAAPDGGLFHYQTAGAEPRLPVLLADTLEAAAAALRLAQCTGDAVWIGTARRLARHMEQAFWAEDGGFWDRTRSDHDVGALRYRDHPFEANAAAARVLLDLAQLTGERGWRALAERTLARMGASAGRHGIAGAAFALATAEFFDPPPTVYVASAGSAPDHAAALRTAALRLPLARLRVWTVPSGHSVGPQRFVAVDSAAAWVCTPRGCSPPLHDAKQLAETALAAAASLTARHA
jgi:uncharacterized protein